MTMTAPEKQNGSASLATRAPREAIVIQDDSEFRMMLDTGMFEQMQRLATAFAASTIIPEHYRGNVSNCFIALQMAMRLHVDPFMFMQKSYMVHGKPGLEAQLAIALVNSSGLFQDALEYEINGDDPEDPTDPSYMVRTWAVRKSTSKRVNGPWVDWKMVNAEGWLDKPGSKWKTMPGIMFMYRAATFFARTACPERLMGMATLDELADIGDPTQVTATPAEPEGSRTETARRSMQRPKPRHEPIQTDAPPSLTAAEKILAPLPTDSLSPEPAAGTTTAPRAQGTGRPQAKKPAPIDTPAPDDAPFIPEQQGDPRTVEQIAEEYSSNESITDLRTWLMTIPAAVRNAAKSVAQVNALDTDEAIRNTAYAAKLATLRGK